METYTVFEYKRAKIEQQIGDALLNILIRELIACEVSLRRYGVKQVYHYYHIIYRYYLQFLHVFRVYI